MRIKILVLGSKAVWAGTCLTQRYTRLKLCLAQALYCRQQLFQLACISVTTDSFTPTSNTMAKVNTSSIEVGSPDGNTRKFGYHNPDFFPVGAVRIRVGSGAGPYGLSSAPNRFSLKPILCVNYRYVHNDHFHLHSTCTHSL